MRAIALEQWTMPTPSISVQTAQVDVASTASKADPTLMSASQGKIKTQHSPQGGCFLLRLICLLLCRGLHLLLLSLLLVVPLKSLPLKVQSHANMARVLRLIDIRCIMMAARLALPEPG